MYKYLLILWMLCISGVVHAQGLPVGKVYTKPTAEPVLTYTEAYSKMVSTDQPLMVIMTAEWCGPCQNLKKILHKNDNFKDVIITYVDIDNETELSSKLRSSVSIPEIIVFKKRKGIWTRRQLVGAQTEESIKELIGEK